jgi:uncharacterized RDD family membrane protein YckC
MTSTVSLYEQTFDRPEDLTKAKFINRIIAKTIDFIIVAALFEIIPKIGYFAGLIYLLIADGLFEGRSIGKRLIGLKVIYYNSSNKAIACGFKESIFRNFPFVIGYILSGIFGIVPLIGWIFSFVIIFIILAFESLVMLGSENGMRLGDEMAKTQVVEDKKGD